MQLPTKPDETPTHVWNPLEEDFTTTYANEQNVPLPYTCPSQTISTFPAYIANKIAKNLAQKVVGQRGIKTNYQDDFQAALREILDITI